jgi:hypothetical protein
MAESLSFFVTLPETGGFRKEKCHRGEAVAG